jgi:hypothetical protein
MDDQPHSSITTANTATTIPAAVLLGRTLKVDDKDAMRLSSEAMALNVMQSFQKAMEWRSHSWVDSLSRVLVHRERQLMTEQQQQGENDKLDKRAVDLLYYSNEAILVAALRQIESKIQVLEANTAFKVLHKVSTLDFGVADAAAVDNGPSLKKQRLGYDNEEEVERGGLEEGEYVYDVIHVLEMQCSLNISTPAGHVLIDLNVPGRIKGTFLSSEDNCDEELTDVTIHLNTNMLASMIEKSSRIAVRASVEAFLRGEHMETSKVEPPMGVAAAKGVKEEAAATPAPKTKFAFDLPCPTRTPKRKLSDEEHPVSGLVVITPARETSSPSSYADSDSDGDNKPVLLQIPDNFNRTQSGSTVLFPQASRAHEGSNLAFASRLPPKKTLKQQGPPPPHSAVVTPLKTTAPEFECREKGPNLPVLVEVACAAMDAKK